MCDEGEVVCELVVCVVFCDFDFFWVVVECVGVCCGLYGGVICIFWCGWKRKGWCE